MKLLEFGDKENLFKLQKALTIALMILIVNIFLPASGFSQERFSVKSKIANIRSGPGTEHETLWQIERYHPLIVLEKKGKWYKFKDFEGDVGWVYSTLLDKTSSVISIKDKCNVRKSSGTEAPIAFTVERGVPFKVLEKKGKWLKIEHVDGDRGWIYKTLVW